MAATFTTWAALYTAMLNTLAKFAAGDKFAVVDYTVGSGGHTRHLAYRTFEEFERAIKFVKHMADQESGAAVGRTYAKQGGGGRW